MTPTPDARFRLHTRSTAAFSGWVLADVVRVLRVFPWGGSVQYRTPGGVVREASAEEWAEMRPMWVRG